MLIALLVDLVFVGAAVYLFLEDHVLPAVVMLVMGTAAAGLLLLRAVGSGAGSRITATRATLLGGSGRPRHGEVTLEPELEESLRVIARSSKIAAIKRVRELTGASLKVAKDYVDTLS